MAIFDACLDVVTCRLEFLRALRRINQRNVMRPTPSSIGLKSLRISAAAAPTFTVPPKELETPIAVDSKAAAVEVHVALLDRDGGSELDRSGDPTSTTATTTSSRRTSPTTTTAASLSVQTTTDIISTQAAAQEVVPAATIAEEAASDESTSTPLATTSTPPLLVVPKRVVDSSSNGHDDEHDAPVASAADADTAVHIIVPPKMLIPVAAPIPKTPIVPIAVETSTVARTMSEAVAEMERFVHHNLSILSIVFVAVRSWTPLSGRRRLMVADR